MGLLRGARRALLGGARRTYAQKVLSYGPLVYFPQWEAAGAVSEELVNGWNGAYTGVTLGQPGIGDGNTCPWYDGINDFDNIWTAALQAAFNGSEGTAAIWGRVNAAGVWTDGATRRLMNLAVDLNNRVILTKGAPAGRLDFYYFAGGVQETVLLVGLGGVVDWFHIAITWSASTGPTGEMWAYYNGAQTGVTQVALGVWAGALAATTTVKGSLDIVPIAPWHGWLAHGAVWTRALAPGEIADLAVV